MRNIFLVFFSLCFIVIKAQNNFPSCSHTTIDKCTDDDCSKYKSGSFRIINNTKSPVKVRLTYNVWQSRGSAYNRIITSYNDLVLSPNSSSDVSQICQGNITYMISLKRKDNQNPDSQQVYSSSPDITESQTIETCKTTVVTIQ
jgi:hypothetical protein